MDSKEEGKTKASSNFLCIYIYVVGKRSQTWQ